MYEVTLSGPDECREDAVNALAKQGYEISPRKDSFGFVDDAPSWITVLTDDTNGAGDIASVFGFRVRVTAKRMGAFFNGTGL